jgi:hypothetical protein
LYSQTSGIIPFEDIEVMLGSAQVKIMSATYMQINTRVVEYSPNAVYRMADIEELGFP